MRRKKFGKRIGALLLAAVLVLGNLPGIHIPVSAETPVFGGLGVKESDPATVNNWKTVLDQLDTSYAGGVWTDKSVFESADAYFDATDEQENFTMDLENPRNFLLSLSAIASTKTIVGYSTLPIDTMFVLDVSGSMDTDNNDARMVQAANKAIGDLLALNNYNRVGVVLYSNSATLLMPLARYTTTSTTTLNGETIPSYIRLNNNDQVVASEGLRDSDGNRPRAYREVVGGTYIQDGIYTAMEQLTDPDLETVITEGFQVGTTRTPIMVLMSDGAPTYASTTYNNVANSTFGNGYASNTTSGMGFVTQLTASYAKEKIGQKYGDEVEPLFYTLGLGVGSDNIALSVMDPGSNTNGTISGYWSTFNALNEGDNMRLDGNNNRRVRKFHDGVNDRNDTMPLSKDYVDQYFPASNSNDLSTAFQRIVDTIILQTMYYPTLVEGGDVHHSGYLEFRDYIGPNMEVKEVEGVQLGSTLYTGERFAELVATGMGTVDRPTEAGNELVRSIITRLKLGQIGEASAVNAARDLLEKAWTAGQLAYNVDYDGNVTWSNWFGWYADENENYLGFWDGEGIDENMKGKAAYAIKSYLVLGDVGEGHRDTDMMYASISVRSALDASGNVIEDIVYGRLPASLIPVIEYNIALNSNDPTTATEITLTKTGATAPSRLIYEVGLRDEIDLLDLEGSATEDLRMDENGNYVFYTNQWDDAGLEEGNHPNKLHNTYVNFYPSEENERYYYHEDMPIYVASGSGYVRYSGEKPAAGDGRTYYRAYVTYSTNTNGGNASYEVDYQVIPDSALAAENVKAQEGTRYWVVKKGTLHLYEARTSVVKSDNVTNTLPYAEYPIVHNDAQMGYHLDGILGNNGKLTIDAPEGIKLTKSLDDTLTDNGETYTFTVELTSGSHDGATIYLITETDGVRSAWREVEFDDSYTVELGAGDSAWLAGLPEGNEYTITEEINGEYEVSAITIDGAETDEAVVSIRENHISDVQITNSAVFTGDIAISKNVVSSYDPHETENYSFSFHVVLTGADANEDYETVIVAADGSETAGTDVTTDDNGEASFYIELSHGQKWVILELPEGAQVEAVEDLLPGFTSDQTDDTASADVIVGETVSIVFTNTYEAEPVSPEGIVDVYVKKILDGRDWDVNDTFTFVLEKHISADRHEVIEEVAVGYDDADKIADFQSNVNDLYEEPGTYSYRITEKTGDQAGIAYDTAICYFDIVVEDDGEGSLYIADVIGRQDVTVYHDDANNTWDITADFTNVYSSEGSVQVSLSVAKDVEDPADTGIHKGGFEFAIFDADEDFNIEDTPRATVVTNAEGVATFRDTIFTEEGTHYFVLTEVEGNVPGMRYDDTVYYCTVDVTSDPETSGLVATGIVVDEDGNELYNETVSYDPADAIVPTLAFTAEFTNEYEPEEVSASISGTKALTGREINDGEFTFELYEAEKTDDGFVTGDYIDEVTNDGDSFTFEALDALTYDKTGYYYYAVKESDGDLGGVTYDGKTVYVAIHVTADLENGELVVSSVNVTDAEGVSTDLTFHNTYVPAPTDASIVASKELTGTRQLAANMFQFYLYETDAAFDVSGDPVQTVTNNANGDVKFALNYNAVGEYCYVVAERTPTNVDASGRLNGVKYDETTYRVKVTVTDDLEGALVAQVEYLDGAAEFVNDYTPAPTSATLSGGKALAGRIQTAGEFAFELYETDAKFIPVDNRADGVASNYEVSDGQFGFAFDTLTFTEAGGYRYVIVERNTGNNQIDYDTTVYYVLISVTDNGRGQLVAQTTVGNAIDVNGTIVSAVSGMEFYNVFTHEPAKLTLSGNKTLKGHEWSHGDTDHVFTFELYEADQEFTIYDGTSPVTAVNDPSKQGSEGVFTFETLTFEEEGTYYYVVKERLPAGITAADPRDDSTGIVYDTKEHHVTVMVAEDPEDPTALRATYVVDGAEGDIAFTNQYTVEGEVFATIAGKKVMEGRNLHTDGFSFVLKGKDGNVIETVKNTGDGTTNEGTFAFAPLIYNTDGEYTYTVEEQRGDIAGVTYSTDVYTVTVTVGHDSNGKPTTPVVTYKKGLFAADEMVFTNIYKAAPSDELVLEGTKVLSGAIVRSGDFMFELYAATVDDEGIFTAGEKLNETTNELNHFYFDGLTYETVGEYHYVIKEQPGSVHGVTYDDNEFYVTVVVEDPGEGKLVARVDQIASKEQISGVGVVFTNTFTPDPIDLTITGKKTLSGRAMEDGEFTFELYETGADHVIAEGTLPMGTASNKNGSFTFDAVELEQVGSYYYVVKEIRGTASRVTYDATVYNVTVNVSNNEGVLEKNVIYKVGSEEKTEIVFHNTYSKPDPQPDPIEVELNVEKVLRGSAYRNGLRGFVFELLDEDGKVIDTARSNEDGEAVLDAGTYRKSDAGETYTFYVREVDTDVNGMVYSTREYEVQITIVYDRGRNKLSYELIKDGDVVDEDEPFIFTNVYNPGGPGDPGAPDLPDVPTSPDTGDEGIGLWVTLLVLSAVGFATTIAFMIFFRRKSRKA